jgi:molecular chaperone DnaK
LTSDDKAAIEKAQAALELSSQKLGEKMYADMQAEQAAQAAAQGAAGAAPGAEQAAKPKDDNVVDAEVKEVKKG